VAGYQLTRDVAIGLGLPFNVAEEMKKKHGSVMPVYESKAQTKSAAAEDGHGASYQDLCDIIRARVEEILRLILLELPRSEYKTLVPAGLVLTGGSSNLSGMDALGREILRLPVRVGMPASIYGISESLRDPAYATAVGLLLWGANHQGTKNWKGPGFGVTLRRLVSRLSSLFR
jgi:cell division protein FtsA